MRLRLLIFLLSAFAVSAMAQTRDTVLLMNYYSAELGLQLKWLPTSDEAFRAGFANGYELFRAEAKSTSDGGEELAEYVKLNPQPIKHWSKERYLEEYKKDSAVDIAGIFISNEELIHSPATAHTMKEAVNAKQSQEFMRMFASFSVLMKNKLADAMGMYYIDKTVDPTKKYLYKLEIPGHPEFTSYRLVFPLAEQKEEKVMGFTTTLYSEAILLSWYNNNNKTYPFYNIYRSTHSKKGFVKLNRLPYGGESGGAQIEDVRTSYVDSFPQYDVTYYYKVVGVNGFETEGPPSEVKKITSAYLLKVRPQFKSSGSLDNKTVNLEWEVADEDIPYIKGFSVKRAIRGEGPYKRISGDLLKPSTRMFTDEDPITSNYYTVCMHGKNGDSLCSILRAVLLIDSIPPAQPVMLTGDCDTNGVVTIQWQRGEEEDLTGYRLFRTFLTEKEPVRIVPGEVADTFYIDTININEPYNSVFYRISAIDGHANPSVQSEYLEVKIPDMKPPTNGYMKDYKVSKKGIWVSFHRSNAYDLKYMHLMRKSKLDFEFVPILSLSGDSLNLMDYTDTLTKSGLTYEYTLVAEDENGLKSGYSNIISATQRRKEVIPAVTGLQAIVNHDNGMIKLKWEFPEKAIGFRLYRTNKKGKLITYEYIEGAKREFYDKNVSPNTKYTYLMIGEMPGGIKSGYSQKIEVKY